MAYTSLFNNIIFIEGDCENVSYKATLEYEKGSWFNQQFKNLDHIKFQFAEKAKNVGANAVINFKYGQKTTSFWKAMLFATDDNVNWYGSGTAVLIPEDKYLELVNKTKNN